MERQKTLINRCFKIVIALAFYTASAVIGEESNQNVKQLLSKFFNNQGIAGKGSFVMDFNVVSIQENSKSEAKIRVFFLSGSKQLVTYLEPERLKDNYYLVNDHNTWMYQTGLQRPLRISAQQKLFGQAGIAETAGIDYCNDYNINGVIDSADRYYITLSAKDSKTAYQHAMIIMRKSDSKIEKILLKAVNGSPLKELAYSDYKQLNGHEVELMMISNLQQEKGKKTSIEFAQIQKKPLPIEAFDPLMMGKFKLE
jgi:outer membrane lipoprotein-sorting protein